jgi:hypothetical protein
MEACPDCDPHSQGFEGARRSSDPIDLARISPGWPRGSSVSWRLSSRVRSQEPSRSLGSWRCDPAAPRPIGPPAIRPGSLIEALRKRALRLAEPEEQRALSRARARAAKRYGAARTSEPASKGSLEKIREVPPPATSHVCVGIGPQEFRYPILSGGASIRGVKHGSGSPRGVGGSVPEVLGFFENRKSQKSAQEFWGLTPFFQRASSFGPKAPLTTRSVDPAGG